MNVGITGHQDLGTVDNEHWVASAIENILSGTPTAKGYTCLAIGADQLFAHILIKKGMPYIAVLACTMIESSFKSDDDKKSFRQFLARAAGTITLPFAEPSEEAYFEAGKKVVDESDLLIAVWNGLPAKGLGGTGDIVTYALKNKRKVTHINLASHEIIEIEPPTFSQKD